MWKPDQLKEQKSFKTTAGNLIYHWNEWQSEWWLLPCMMLFWAGAHGHVQGPPRWANQGNASAHALRKAQPGDLTHPHDSDLSSPHLPGPGHSPSPSPLEGELCSRRALHQREPCRASSASSEPTVHHSLLGFAPALRALHHVPAAGHTAVTGP